MLTAQVAVLACTVVLAGCSHALTTLPKMAGRTIGHAAARNSAHTPPQPPKTAVSQPAPVIAPVSAGPMPSTSGMNEENSDIDETLGVKPGIRRIAVPH
ncbi:conserved exported protein of unknown function [Rhodovastum atsumiense]|uniref:Lipoprotein n=1 Tax=Rhodovastum atsumiense TaxID=504468 RepID=A0A5M6IUY4_9PROT|nr:hypothetical protein [Rhodovastum atsumiense]KAA5611225.1 hypothetical protein F1189_15770 [Rhodovastum atsumiense]CAH2602462.1 conserved exported protein of unknown function [Rhodovastum atsumiense]